MRHIAVEELSCKTLAAPSVKYAAVLSASEHTQKKKKSSG